MSSGHDTTIMEDIKILPYDNSNERMTKAIYEAARNYRFPFEGAKNRKARLGQANGRRRRTEQRPLRNSYQNNYARRGPATFGDHLAAPTVDDYWR